MNDVLVLRLSALGDVIHTMPAVSALREAHPAARIRWVVEAPYRELVEVVTGVEAVPVRLRKWEFREALQRMKGADTSIDFQGLIKSAAVGWAARARTRIGFDRNAVREKPALLFTNKKVRVDTTQHIIDQNLALISGVAGSQPAEASRAKSPALQRETLHWDRFATAEGFGDFADAIVLLPGAGKPNKLWPIERFRELAKVLGPRTLVVWGPGERERAQAIGARVAPPTSLRELAWILAHAKLVIGGDTGPLHLADALGTKVIGLYGPTNPRRNGPYYQLENVVDHFSSTKLMDSITVSEVMNLVHKVNRE
jgi:lipopolysaccharide heptosyltransferase I